MIGTAYYNSGRVMGLERIGPAVPGGQYRITAWALDTGGVRRSRESKVKSATTGEAGECDYMAAALMLIVHMYVHSRLQICASLWLPTPSSSDCHQTLKLLQSCTSVQQLYILPAVPSDTSVPGIQNISTNSNGEAHYHHMLNVLAHAHTIIIQQTRRDNICQN